MAGEEGRRGREGREQENKVNSESNQELCLFIRLLHLALFRLFLSIQFNSLFTSLLSSLPLLLSTTSPAHTPILSK